MEQHPDDGRKRGMNTRYAISSAPRLSLYEQTECMSSQVSSAVKMSKRFLKRGIWPHSPGIVCRYPAMAVALEEFTLLTPVPHPQ